MIDRKSITQCPLCGSNSIEHVWADHKSKIRGMAYNVPQTICHTCKEVLLGPDSLAVIQTYQEKEKLAA
ncbi:MAG: hypothetical protein HQK75_08875 [Candidatus Magnetomorum sp.]|nr:hypothetical protein [Candidatus Magnetomorum sp.]